ncbi:cupredoxin domain-containing protein [Colwellia hornerae]|uniref:Cupredoxin domain-containing protein n=1 Tax=Colwellia hornerae TaxID=89402 RepID=A0A5C6QHC8_9GAMM|nr:cupredoxin domain-containing protein [Colwellia hornerae]TWX52877.1 cupredoxin domain-containing protein [Colwellia hornerae]TWX59231.1 cupredoxin domain-containing protein [Colwellia hornerae]TWX68259.1 cupredoxin domain-containing protein [Colwellia hornerae]
MISLFISLIFSPSVWAERTEYVVELKDHLFFPAVIKIPPNEKVKLIIYNRDTTPEEFDSFDLNREKVIFPNKRAVIFIGPLPEGKYHFFGEFNPNSAKGTIIVTPMPKRKKAIKVIVKNSVGGA